MTVIGKGTTLQELAEAGLQIETRNNDDGSVDVICRDTVRHSNMVWRVNSTSATRMAVEIPLTALSYRSIYSYFEHMRQRHPEGYLTCECHKHIREVK